MEIERSNNCSLCPAGTCMTNAQKAKQKKNSVLDHFFTNGPQIEVQGLKLGPVGIMFQCVCFRVSKNKLTHLEELSNIHKGLRTNCCNTFTVIQYISVQVIVVQHNLV